MKKITSILLFAATAAALVSCNKEIEKPTKENNSIENTGIKVQLVSSGIDTKTYVEGTTPKWKTTDKIGVVDIAKTTQVQGDIASLTENIATFEATVASAGDYFAYYPKSTYDIDSEGASVRLQQDQYPTPTSFDGNADLLVSEGFNVTSVGDPINIRFRRLGSFIKVQFADNTTSGLTDDKVIWVSMQAGVSLLGKVHIDESGVSNFEAGYKTVKAHFDEGVYSLTTAGQETWFGVYPTTLPKDSELIFNIQTQKRLITKTVTVPDDIVIGAGQILPITVNIKESDLCSYTIERKWGKYSTNSAYWNASFSGTASSDRNIAMDDDYIYLPETTAAAKLWKIPLDGVTDPSLADVTGVSGGDHALSCVRMIPNTSASVNGGKDFLMGVSLTTNDESTPMKVYSWKEGTSKAPVSTSVSTYCGRRLGDKFTVYGSLQDGALFFKDWNNVSNQGAFLVLRTAFSVAPTDGLFNPRRTNMISESGIGAYYPYPDDPTKGIYAGVGSDAYYSSFTSSPLNTNPNESGTFTKAAGYYGSTAGYNFIEYGGKRYVIYVKNAGGGDGRVYILEGSLSDGWESILTTRTIIYQADIQQNLAYFDGEYHTDLETGVTKTSANSALDCTTRIIDGKLYIAALKQGVGLSFFEFSLIK